jgi:phospholipid/cholesterol/gamma-HCH transport system substrate-binding protein
METRANYVAVGFFTMAVILASFAFIYWVAKLDESAPQRPLNVRILGAVTGLAAGSEVHFNGIKVGQVNRVVFNPDDPREVFAISQINEDTPVRADTTATIGSQGLTGVAYISLKGGSPDAISLFETGENGNPPMISAKPSAVADILETVRDVASKANDTLGSLKQFVEESRGPMSTTLSNVEKFSGALGRNSEGIDEFLQSASGIGQSLSSLGEKMDGTIKGLEKLVEAVDPQKVKNTVDNVEAFTGNLKRGSEKIDTVVASVEKIATDLESFSGNLNASLKKFDGVMDAVDSESVKQAVADIRETASGAKQVVNDARGLSQTLANRKGDIDAIVTSAKEMTDRLNQSSKLVDGVLVKLDGFLGAEGSESVMSDILLTLADFRKVAQTLQTSVTSISGGLSRFSNSGLQDLQSLIGDARRSVSRIDRVISNVERNPQGLLFGNSADVKTFNGRPRR